MMFIQTIALGLLALAFYYVIDADLKADRALAKARKDKRDHDDCGCKQ